MKPGELLEIDPTAIDLGSPVPAYLQVEQDLRRQILGAKLGAMTRLPRETDLADLYGISRMTLRNALERLEEARLIQRRHGVGTIVTRPAATVTCDLGLMKRLQVQIREQGYAPGIRIEQKGIISPPRRIAEALRLTEGEQVLLISRVILADDRPMAMIRSYISLSRFPGIAEAELEENSLWRTFECRYGRRIKHTSNQLEIAELSSTEALALQLSDRERTICLRGIAFDQDDVPVEYSHALWVPTARVHFDAHG